MRIKILNESIIDLYELQSNEVNCHKVDNNSTVVYINNPKYLKGSKVESPYISSAPLIALTKSEYEII